MRKKMKIENEKKKKNKTGKKNTRKTTRKQEQKNQQNLLELNTGVNVRFDSWIAWKHRTTLTVICKHLFSYQ